MVPVGGLLISDQVGNGMPHNTAVGRLVPLFKPEGFREVYNYFSDLNYNE